MQQSLDELHPPSLPWELMAYHLETIEEVEQANDFDTAYEPLFNVVLLNDDHHSDIYVVEMLGRLFYISPAQAMHHVIEVDTTGRTIVMTCERLQAEFARDQIHAYGPDRTIQACKGSMSAIVEPAEVAK